jgi:predicted transcriptional regulator YdeE
MKAAIGDRAAMRVVGVEIRTNNKLEMSNDGKIPALWQRVRSESLLDSVPQVVEPGIVLAVYSDYANGADGDYSFLIGVQVSGSDGTAPAGMVSKTIPASRVARVTSAVGPLPNIVIALWKEIWKMSPTDLGGRRLFTFDIERYDARAKDDKHAQVEVTLAIA